MNAMEVKHNVIPTENIPVSWRLYIGQLQDISPWSRILTQRHSTQLTREPYRRKISKRYSSLKSLLNLFKPFLKFRLSCPHKRTVLGFWNFEFTNFHDFVSFSLTWDPMAAKTSKRYPSNKYLWISSNFNFLNLLLSGPHKSTVLDFWNFEVLIFNKFWKFTIIPKTSIIWETSGRRGKRG